MKIMTSAVSIILLQNGMATLAMNGTGWYVAGAIIALFLFAYLVYALIKPEKF